MNCHENIIFNNIKFHVHPIYNRYAASKEGQIYGKKHKIILKQNENTGNGGYLYFFAYGEKGRKNYSVSRFVYECFYGEIPNDKQIDHIDNNKHNNRLNNLQLLSKKENIEKAHNKSVISFNIETRKEKKFRSIKEASEEIGISSSMFCAICKKRCKIAKSKKDGMIYIFNYDDWPNKHKGFKAS